MGTVVAPSIESRVAGAFQDIPEVESVYVLRRNEDVFKVFTIVNEEDDAVYRLIFQRELTLLSKLPSTHIDFNVITRHNRPVQEFLGKNSPAWERKASENGQTSSVGQEQRKSS
jgi:hypothetical protein